MNDIIHKNNHYFANQVALTTGDNRCSHIVMGLKHNVINTYIKDNYQVNRN